VLHSADMQFRGQTHLIRVSLPRTDMTREEIQALFEEAYFARFQIRLPEVRAVLVNLNTSVIGRRRAFPLGALLDASECVTRPADAIIGERRMYAAGAWHDAKVYDRGKLPVVASVAGPAVIQQIDATTVVEPGAVAEVDAIGNLRIRVAT
jgi:N-methylhydantoinase A